MKAIVFVITILSALSWADAADNTLTLSRFLKEVRSTSPDLEIEKANMNAARARATGIRLSAPMVGFMQMKEGQGARRGLEVSQEIPFPTKVIQDKTARRLQFEAQKENSNYEKSLVLAEGRLAYISYWASFERLKIQRDKARWLKDHIKLTRAATRGNSLVQLHLLEAESEAGLIDNEVLAHEAVLEEKWNALRIYAPSLTVDSAVPEEPELPTIDIQKSGDSPLISWKEKELASREALVGLKKQAYLPDLFLRLRSFESGDTFPESQEIMIGISVPFLFFWQPKADAAEASAQRARAEAELQKAKIQFESELLSLSKKSQSIRVQMKNIKEELLPRAERSKRLVEALSQRTIEGLNQHKSVMLNLLDLRIAAIDLRLQYEEALSEILKLTGVREGRYD